MYTITSPSEIRTTPYDGTAVMIRHYLGRHGEPVTINPPIRDKRGLAAMGRVLSENYPAGQRIHLGIDPANDHTVAISRSIDGPTEISIDGTQVKPVSYEEMKAFIQDELKVELTEFHEAVVEAAVTEIATQEALMGTTIPMEVLDPVGLQRLVSIGADPDDETLPTIAPSNFDEMEVDSISGKTREQLYVEAGLPATGARVGTPNEQLETLAAMSIVALRKMASHAGLKNAYKGGFDKPFLIEYITQHPVQG